MEHIRFRITPNQLFNRRKRMIKLVLCKLDEINCPDQPAIVPWQDRIKLEAFAQHEYDKFRDLDIRMVAGAGALYIFKSETIDVGIGTAYMFEYLDFNQYFAKEHNNRWSNYLQLEIDPHERISIASVTFIQPRLEDMSDILIMTSLGLKVKATDWFGVQLNFGLDYDSDPPPNIKNFGVGTGAELVVEF